ncbi:MAG: DEAD/DEAH box helicase family protein [Anaerolineaceae bacterium]|nr:DEAD/DEAH box helicase family protein [Anaerolineaceae bacterium]
MNLQSIKINQSYESGTDDLVDDFYNPVLQVTKQYDRLAGFFSSSSLAIAARGISGLIKNGGSIRLIASPKLNKEDVEVISQAKINPTSIIEKKLNAELEYLENEFVKDHLGALGWLIESGKLEIRVAIIKGNENTLLTEDEIISKGIFHQKVGVLRDLEGNILSFSGSLNESANGWVNNIEEFKVFKSWEVGQLDYCLADIQKFENIWYSRNSSVQVLEIPEAVSKRLISYANYEAIEKISINKYNKKIQSNNIRLSLFPFQEDAIKTWNNHGKKLICEMATGTGKTRTAIGCIAQLIDEENSLVVIVSCPQNTLSRQWKNELLKNNVVFEEDIIADSTNPKWRSDLQDKLFDISLGTKKNLIIYSTHDTCSSSDFINILELNKRKIKYFFVGDEAHGLGAPQSSNSLQPFYDFRLGLSATPKRWYDDSGTKKIYDFFGEEPFEFSLAQAMCTINPLTNRPFLCGYVYHPIFVTLTDQELEKYAELTKKISRMSRFGCDDERNKVILENFLFQRANIHKNAINKLNEFEILINSFVDKNNLLIFVSPQQLSIAMKILTKNGFIAHKFTEKEGVKEETRFGGKTERQFIIDLFKSNRINALVAMKCLDEGIDIPSARQEILLASSSNPREYVQRIGRVIRQSPGKESASIFDFIVTVDSSRFSSELIEIEKKVFEKEMLRALEIAQNSINNADATRKIYTALRGEVDEC